MSIEYDDSVRMNDMVGMSGEFDSSGNGSRVTLLLKPGCSTPTTSVSSSSPSCSSNDCGGLLDLESVTNYTNGSCCLISCFKVISCSGKDLR